MHASADDFVLELPKTCSFVLSGFLVVEKKQKKKTVKDVDYNRGHQMRNYVFQHEQLKRATAPEYFTLLEPLNTIKFVG